MIMVVDEKRHIEKGLVIQSRVGMTSGLEITVVEFRRVRVQP